DTIEQQLADDASIVVVTGPDGVGKSTVLRQFVDRHDERAFSLFLSSASRWAYDPATMLDELCAQIESVIPPNLVPADTIQGERRFARLVTALDRRARSSGQVFYFVLDGLEDIPEEDRGTRDELIGLMPFGFPGFRYLLSGELIGRLLPPAAKRQLRTFPI